MFNKLSFLPTEDIHPVCIALDDYQDIEDNNSISHYNDIIDSEDVIRKNIDFAAFLKELEKHAMTEGVTIKTLYNRYFKQSYSNNIDKNPKIYELICESLPIKYKKDSTNFEDFVAQFYTYCVIKRGDIVKNRDMLAYAKKITIQLVESADMPNNSAEESTEYLGYYSSLCEDGQHPLICLCPERIKAAAINNIDKKVLFAKVLIHELAHAMMDSTNKLDKGYLIKNGEPKIKSDADSFMEESLANMITLEYFEAAKSIIGKDDFKQVKSFMENQLPAYKFGITQYELLHTDWEAWRDNKSTIKFWAEWGAIVQPHIEELKKLKIV